MGEIHSGLSSDMGELEVAFLSTFFEYFDNYLNNNLSADDYNYFNENFARFRALWSKYSSNDDLNRLSKDFQLLDDYYAANVKRNGYFLDNITASKFTTNFWPVKTGGLEPTGGHPVPPWPGRFKDKERAG